MQAAALRVQREGSFVEARPLAREAPKAASLTAAFFLRLLIRERRREEIARLISVARAVSTSPPDHNHPRPKVSFLLATARSQTPWCTHSNDDWILPGTSRKKQYIADNTDSSGGLYAIILP